MHTIAFYDRENSWDNGLPMGNGVFGGMGYYRGNTLTAALNHYEVYYNISDRVLPEDILAGSVPAAEPGRPHTDTYERAERNRPDDGEPFYYYRLDKEKGRSYATAGFSGSYPSTGDVEFVFEPASPGSRFSTRIDLEDAAVRLERENAEAELRILRKDCLCASVCQERAGVLKAIRLRYAPQRDLSMPDVSWKQENSRTFLRSVVLPLGTDGKSLRFCTVMRLIGATGTLSGDTVVIDSADTDMTALCGVFTDYALEGTGFRCPEELALVRINAWESELPALLDEHRSYWDAFFSRSRIHIPDAFLEKIYVMNQYALDCCSGRDSVMRHHACGLNGLWDVKHPTLWGSMWYWDVNIQAAFAGVFSSNRLDLGKVFSDGLLRYVELAEAYARDQHDMDGAACDYPYAFYYCVWPWCAQYLWSQFEYSRDLNYLRRDAYPLFLKLCRFCLDLFRWDAGRGCFSVYPDISPEQGPLAHNSVITVASVKYMLKFTLEAAELLGDNDPLLPAIRNLYSHMPPYPVGDGHLKDSEDAPANLWIRHPSTLMSIFPTGEIHLGSDPEWVEIAKNTVTYLEEHCEIGVFQVSWLAACAARFGQGQKALRLLYEMGIDHLLRSNGLAAEENERFINYCLIMRQPLFYPCMMEFTGEMLAAVNEMLLQSDNGVIRLFPAMPDGDPEYDRLIRRGYSLHEYSDRCRQYDAWRNARFDRLLARGAFVCSAELKDGAVSWASVRSNAGGTVRITSPFSLSSLRVFRGTEAVPFSSENGILSFVTESGANYRIVPDPAFVIPSEPDDIPDDGVLTHESYTHRCVWLGENTETGYRRALDSFIRDSYLGNVRVENHTVYKFDLGVPDTEKDYAADIYPQFFGAEHMMLHGMAFLRLPDPVFSVYQGYGFRNNDLERVDRGSGDVLRRDCIRGEHANDFLIEAPKGQYELLVISGDRDEDTYTSLAADGGRAVPCSRVPAGSVRCDLLPLVMEDDGCITLHIGTLPGRKWAVDAILLNTVRRF